LELSATTAAVLPDLADAAASGSHSLLLLASMSDEDQTSLVATALGYLIGLGSLLLYTPIAVRVVRQRSADGLALSTWWLKLGSYLCSDVFYITKGYPLSTYVETLTVTIEAGVVLVLVAYFQRSLFRLRFAGLASGLALLSLYGLTAAPPEAVAFGQVASVALNSGALLPQFVLNARRRTKGDYSPVTAGLASTGCAIRMYTTIALADSDPILLGTFSAAFLLNSALLGQILYYGMVVEGLSPIAVFMADVKSVERTRSRSDAEDAGGEIELFQDEEVWREES
jgi:mannose-P-dolichol utilization defect protein 1